MPRKLIAFVLVLLGMVCSIFFSFNWGFTFFDVVDNYLNTYLMLVLGVLETMGASWVYEAGQIFEKGRNYKISLLILAGGFWTAAIIIPFVCLFSESGDGWVGMPVFWGWLLIVWGISWLVSGLPFGEWKSNIACYGARKLSRSMTKLSKTPGDRKTYCWEIAFEYWWGFSIKYWVPFALNWLIFFSLKNDLDIPYGGYHIFWQGAGFCFPIAGLLVFFITLCFCRSPEPFDHDVDAAFDENDHEGTGAESTFAAGIKSDAPKKDVELAAIEAD